MNLNAQYPLHKVLNALLPKVECAVPAWSSLEGKVRAQAMFHLQKKYTFLIILKTGRYILSLNKYVTENINQFPYHGDFTFCNHACLLNARCLVVIVAFYCRTFSIPPK